ncbi:AAA family ATPase [uncultured Bartonella sp.]|uniref:ATP-dependent nuclease n=1 Tax=uncultured Bartonella sp. TaxID=104108 RepID=UPI0025D95ADE|nr:AAA family ATPase [uncultured Bartonella sp.]
MARIKKIEIQNFRGIKSLEWYPSNGINCLIGHGDSGKSTLLDAIDMCIGARRNISFYDTDFFKLDVENPISITVTLGSLSDDLKNIDTYGDYLRGFDSKNKNIEDEPRTDLETVLSVNLSVGADLDPIWSLFSERAQARGLSSNLKWADRVRLSPTRIGNISDYNLSWKKGSILNKLSDETADASLELATAARSVRTEFGESAQKQLVKALDAVKSTTDELGIPTGGDVKAMLDAHSISFSSGVISLHDANGVPLKNLGVGSTRLLIAGLQRKAAESSSVLLVDEFEYGLEPHRIIKFLDSLGAKEHKVQPPLQVFMTTHSPTALRELSKEQLYILRHDDDKHHCIYFGEKDDVQGTIRRFPEAFLGSAILVCEGASEVGVIRGLDQYRSKTTNSPSIHALGVCLVDAGGVDNIYKRALPLINAGYRVAVLRDDDKSPDEDAEESFTDKGGRIFSWQEGHSIEDAIFLSLPKEEIVEIVDYAIKIHGKKLIEDHFKTVSRKQFFIADFDELFIRNKGTDEERLNARKWISAASKTKSTPWFKNVSAMEYIGKEIIEPDLDNPKLEFDRTIAAFFSWAENNA